MTGETTFFHDYGDRRLMGKKDRIGRQQAFGHQDMARRHFFERMHVYAHERPQDLAAEIHHIVGALTEHRIMQLTQSALLPLEHALHHLLGVDQLMFQLDPQSFDERRTVENDLVRAEDIRQFRAAFLKVLTLVQTQYRAAKVTADAGGLELRNSLPPVAPRLVPARKLLG